MAITASSVLILFRGVLALEFRGERDTLDKSNIGALYDMVSIGQNV